VIRRVIKIKMTFYNSGECESSGMGRVADDDGADSMPRFRRERGGYGMKYCRKMKRR
jgi:hypothetical protein